MYLVYGNTLDVFEIHLGCVVGILVTYSKYVWGRCGNTHYVFLLRIRWTYFNTFGCGNRFLKSQIRKKYVSERIMGSRIMRHMNARGNTCPVFEIREIRKIRVLWKIGQIPDADLLKTEYGEL